MREWWVGEDPVREGAAVDRGNGGPRLPEEATPLRTTFLPRISPRTTTYRFERRVACSDSIQRRQVEASDWLRERDASVPGAGAEYTREPVRKQENQD